MTTAHVHQDKIIEWASDPTYPWQYRSTATGKWFKCNGEPGWCSDVEYRHKPRWFDMEQKWIDKGKPPVEYLQYIQGAHECWLDVNGEPEWNDDCKYRLKEVSRHEALKAEWEAKGRPEKQYKQESEGVTEWRNIVFGVDDWMEYCEYRIKPTPHPNADVLRALAEDGSLGVSVSFVQAANLVERLLVTPPIGYILSVELKDK